MLLPLRFQDFWELRELLYSTQCHSKEQDNADVLARQHLADPRMRHFSSVLARQHKGPRSMCAKWSALSSSLISAWRPITRRGMIPYQRCLAWLHSTTNEKKLFLLSRTRRTRQMRDPSSQSRNILFDTKENEATGMGELKEARTTSLSSEITSIMTPKTRRYLILFPGPLFRSFGHTNLFFRCKTLRSFKKQVFASKWAQKKYPDKQTTNCKKVSMNKFTYKISSEINF